MLSLCELLGHNPTLPAEIPPRELYLSDCTAEQQAVMAADSTVVSDVSAGPGSRTGGGGELRQS